MNRDSGRTSGVRIKDIAEKLSLSTCTVSRILSGKTDGFAYAAKTRQRVLLAARDMNYQPHMVARALVSGRTRTVGLCVANIDNPVFGRFAMVFENAAMEKGYLTFTCNMGDDIDTQSQYVNMLLNRRVDSVVISPVADDIAELVDRATSQGCRIVVFDRAMHSAAVSSVLTDNYEAMYRLASRCIRLGHRDFGVITGNRMDTSLNLRVKGVRDALTDSGLNASEALKISSGTGATTVDSGSVAMGRLLGDVDGQPSVVLCMTNFLTIGALERARSLGIDIGGSVSLAGFDDFSCSTLVTPPITVVAQPISEMARECARLACGEEPAFPETHMFTARIVWRQSVQKAKTSRKVLAGSAKTLQSMARKART